jgi:hypothetical protein
MTEQFTATADSEGATGETMTTRTADVMIDAMIDEMTDTSESDPSGMS